MTEQVNVFKGLSKEAQAEIALQMVLMDAMQKGCAKKEDLISFMQTDFCQKKVAEYLESMNSF